MTYYRQLMRTSVRVGHVNYTLNNTLLKTDAILNKERFLIA